MSTLRMKAILAVLVLTVIIGLTPPAHAQFHVVIAGSSSMWQTMALGAYNNGVGPSDAAPGTFHWTSATNALSLQDCRPQLAGAVNCTENPATVWVVWDSNLSGPDIWVFAKVNSLVGDRCFFANPPCRLVDLKGTNADWLAAGANQISPALWGDSSSDTTLPGPVLNFVESAANIVNTAATDLRPEDAEWTISRVNSALGASAAGGLSSDNLDGLGYGVNPAGVPPTPSPCPPRVTLAQGVGTSIRSGYGGSTNTANVVAFNISGLDPFSCSPITGYAVMNVGAVPIVFFNSRSNTLAALATATERQLENVFSGTNTDAGGFGLPAGNINAFLREPLSGTMSTTEATVFRYPTLYSASTPAPIEGISQEENVGTNNPLICQAGTTVSGLGCRYRGISPSEVIGGVLHSNDGTKVSNMTDGIAYTYFNYGDLSVLADQAGFGYITLNGVDPIFATYNLKHDPGQPAAVKGTVPSAADAGGFPQCEKNIWTNGFSFPNVRNGIYRSWSMLRFVYGGTVAIHITHLVTSANPYVVNTVPDYIPYGTATALAGGTCGAANYADIGIKLIRSHYAQFDGNGSILGGVPTFPGIATSNTTGPGGDMGGIIIPTALGGYTAFETYMVQSGNPVGDLGPASRH